MIPEKLKYPRQKYFQKSVMEEFIIGSESMQDVMDIVAQAARYDVNILIMGESGVGKEMLAKIIHLQSPRAHHPFIAVNCGVLSGLMFEDKLFGHEKGAFTGAIDQKQGCFETADGGTLFLDEVSELPLDNQVDFLRVLEEFRFTRIGGSDMIDVDVRIIAATNKDLRKQIGKGLFREDLYYRLQVVPIYLPPLRTRKKVIPDMTAHFLTQFEISYKKPKPSISPDVLDIFMRYDWPGNVRELKNLIERVFILTMGDVITPEHLPSDFLNQAEKPREVVDLAEIRKQAETRAICDALRRTDGNREKASELLNISPRTLRHKIQKYCIPPR